MGFFLLLTKTQLGMQLLDLRGQLGIAAQQLRVGGLDFLTLQAALRKRRLQRLVRRGELLDALRVRAAVGVAQPQQPGRSRRSAWCP
ncbi:hypothetical protein SSTU70S_03019 [Stutzerimonas stutzeri]